MPNCSVCGHTYDEHFRVTEDDPPVRIVGQCTICKPDLDSEEKGPCPDGYTLPPITA